MLSLKSKITINLALLLLVTIMVTHMVIIGIMGREFIQEKIIRERRLFAEAAGYFLEKRASGMEAEFRAHDWTYACLKTIRGETWSIGDNPDGMWNDIGALTNEILSEETSRVHYRGETWGVFGKRHKYAVISDVIRSDAVMLGAGTVVVPLDDIYHVLRRSQKFVMIYLFANMAVLLLFGIYRFSGLVLRPIRKMIRMTEGYRDTGQALFPLEKRYPEFFQLSDAVNRMINHIESDKNRLLNSLGMLEKANTDLKKAQAEMIRAEKLASIGRLSAGLAHEIGNPIGIVLGYLGLIRQRPVVKTDDIAQDYIDRSESEIHRINAIVRQLLDFSRKGTGNISDVHLHDLIDDVVGMMSHQPLMKHIRISCELAAPTDCVLADPQQLRQVLLNVMINAADAIAVCPPSNAGEIRLITDIPPEGGMIRLRVADNGAGIDPENIDNIFDPFYTTKEPGKGTGLGLSVSYMIIRQAGGIMNVESEPGKGATLTIMLPLAVGTEPMPR